MQRYIQREPTERRTMLHYDLVFLAPCASQIDPDPTRVPGTRQSGTGARLHWFSAAGPSSSISCNVKLQWVVSSPYNLTALEPSQIDVKFKWETHALIQCCAWRSEHPPLALSYWFSWPDFLSSLSYLSIPDSSDLFLFFFCSRLFAYFSSDDSQRQRASHRSELFSRFVQ